MNTTPDPPVFDEGQSRLQLEAEQAERAGLPASGNPALDGYRVVFRALRQPTLEQLPQDFAARVATRVIASEDTRLEDAMVAALMLVLAAGGLFYLQPVLAQLLATLRITVPAVPWPLLGAAAAALVVAWLVDRGASGWQRSHHAH